MEALKIREIKVGIVAGPTAAGKGSTSRGLIEKHRNTTKLSVSLTTREPREGETEGIHYHFATQEEFSERARNGGFLEYKQVHGNWYGSPVLSDAELESTKLLLFEIDVQGVEVIMHKLPQSRLLFLDTSNEVLISRAKGRDSNISQQEISKRLKTAEFEREWAIESLRHHRERCCFLDNSAYPAELCIQFAEAYFLS